MPSISEKGIIHLVPVLVVGLLGFLFISSLVPVKRHYNDGKSNVAGVYLAKGGDDSSEGSSGSSGGGDSHDSGSSGSTTSGGSTTTTNTSPTATPEIHKAEKIETPEPKPQETNKGTFTKGNVKVQFEIHDDGRVEIQTEAKDGGKTTKLEDEAVRELETELEKDDVKIATAPGQIALVNKKVGALTRFPISIDPTTRQLSVTTPAGVKTVAILPQKAVDNLLASHVMDDVVNEKVSNSLASIPEMVRMEVENGVLGFKVQGTKTHKLLGLIPIKTGVNAFVSAENGQVVETNESLLGKILNRIAP